MIRFRPVSGFLWFLVALALHVWPGAVNPTRAQGSRKDDIVFNTRGVPLAGATVRVCAMPASGQPCTPLALIYSDPGLTQALANPTTTDGLGNYFFYAAPGKYEIEISGPSITTKQIPNVILPSDPSSPTFSSISTSGGISAFSLTLTGNLTVNGSTSVVGNLASGTLTLSNQSSPPGSAGAGTVNLYTKTADKRLYYKDDTGTEIGPIATASGAQTNVVNTFTAQQNFKSDVAFSLNPSHYITSPKYGAVSDNVTGTVSVSNGNTTVNLSAAYGFTNGEGVNISQAGITPSLSTPAAPTVTTGNVEGLLVPNAQLNSATGSSSYTYWLVYRSLMGGLSAAGAQTTISNGLTLGMQGPVSASSATLVGHTLTITFSSTPAGLANGAHFSYDGSSNPSQLSAKSQVTGTTATTVTAIVANYCPPNLTCSGTGGTFTWANGNQVSFSLPAAPVWQAYICGKRPGDSSGHVIGATDPILANYSSSGYAGYEYGVNPAQNTWTDFGATITNPTASSGLNGGTFPWYVTDSICSNASVTNEFLSTTIVSGAGTTSLVLANAPSQTASGLTIQSDAAPNILAADQDAFSFSTNQRGSITIPDTYTSNRGVFLTHTPLLLHSLVYLVGNIQNGETITFQGNLSGVASFAVRPQFSWNGYSAIQNYGAYPSVVWDTDQSALYQVVLQGSNNASKVLLAAKTQNVVVENTALQTGPGSTDYCGMALEVAPSAFNFRTKDLTILSGPNQTGDSSWCPGAFYMNNASAGTMLTSLEGFTYASPRGFYFDGISWPFRLDLGSYYSQGAIFPAISVFNVANPAINFTACDQTLDTSAEAILDVEQVGGPTGMSTIDACGLRQTASGGGIPTTGTVQGMVTINRNPAPNGSGLTPPAMFGPGVLSYNSRGQLSASSLQAIGAQPTVTGTGACATTSSPVGGSWSGKITCTGTTGASTVTITPVASGGALTPLNGWSCSGSDETAGTVLAQSGDSATSCTLKGTVNANDVITFNLVSF